MTTNRFLIIVYIISTVAFIVWSYFDKTINQYAWWEFLGGGFCFFIFGIVILGALDLIPIVKDAMPEGYKQDRSLHDYLNKIIKRYEIEEMVKDINKQNNP